ncbi:MAG: hypothetical protein LBQ27_05545, partial [Clostridiales bacterium]|nr:hypothetical protein [Clostridiales bacterium]
MKGLIYSAQNSTAVIYVMLTALIVIFACILFLLLRLKKCPQGKLMIVIGKFHDGAKCRIVRYGDVKFVIPFIQSCQYLSLEPIKTEVSIEFNERQELFLKETG